MSKKFLDESATPSFFLIVLHFCAYFATGIETFENASLYICTPYTLHILYTEAGATNNCDFRRVDQVLEEPLHLSQKTYAASGFVTFPVMDGGMGEVDTNIVQISGYKWLNLS